MSRTLTRMFGVFPSEVRRRGHTASYFLAVCTTLIAGLSATLVAFPLAVGLALPLLALGAWGGQLARITRLATPTLTDPPPPRRVA